jgi:hypothetical protein
MVTDGEVSLVIAGVDALSGLIDLISIAGLSVWVDDLGELQSFLPAAGGWRKWFSRWIKDMV